MVSVRVQVERVNRLGQPCYWLLAIPKFILIGQLLSYTSY